MKQFAYIPFIALLLLVAGSCTLSMEEWVETEEQKGYDRVETIENEYMSLKYEYKKTTRSLTEEIQKYIALIEADSVLYFLDSTPPEYLPQAGGQVVANCCVRFPLGCLGRVLSVERIDGFYKVVTTSATLEDCYEEFDFEFASPLYMASPEEQQRDTVTRVRRQNTRGGADVEEKEVVITDWTMYNRMIQAPRTRTRASFEDVFKEDLDKDTTETKDVLILQVKPGDAVGTAIKKLTKGIINTIDFNLYYTTKMVTHKIVNLKQRREYTKTDQSSGLKISGVIGHDFLQDKSDKAKKEMADNLWEHLANADSRYKQKLASKISDDMPALVLQFPIGTTPFAIIVRIKPVIDVELGIYGSVEATVWLSRNVTETDIVNDVKKKDTNVEKNPPADTRDFNLFGTFSAAGGMEIFAGVGPKPITNDPVALGVRLQATINLDLSINPKALMGYIASNEDDALKLSGKGELGGAFLTGGWWGDIKFFTWPFTWWNGLTFSYNPRIQMDTNFPFQERYDDAGDKYYEQTVSYYFKNLGMLSGFWTTQYKPVIAIYDSENASLDKPVEVLYPEGYGASEEVKTKKSYKFIYKNRTTKPVYAVPGLSPSSGKGSPAYLYPNYKVELVPLITPTIEYDETYDHDAKAYDYVYQTYGRYLRSTPEGDVYYYKYVLPFTLRNATAIDEHWDDWGVYFYFHNIPYRFGKNKYKSLKNSVKKSGKYVAVVSFYSGIDSDASPIEAEASVYYKPKGSTSTFTIDSPNEALYMFRSYKKNKTDEGNYLLKRSIPLTSDIDDEFSMNTLWDGFKKISVPVE